jgi:tetratricopeptide (TPR) repeat protein
MVCDIISCVELAAIIVGVWRAVYLLKNRKGINEPPPKEALKEESKGANTKTSEELSEKSKEPDGKNDKNPQNLKAWFYKILSQYIPLGLIIILLFVDICFHICDTVIKDDHIILVFVGILATFVVISNFAQVKDAKDEFAKERARLEAVIEDKIKQAKDEFDKAQTQLESQIKDPLKALSEDIDSRIEKEKNLMRHIDIQSTESFATSTSRLANVFAEQKNYKEALIYHAMAASAYTKLVNQYNKGDHTGHLNHSINKMIEMVQLMQSGNIPKFDEEGLLDLRYYMMEIGNFRLNRVTDFINGIELTDKNTQTFPKSSS